MRSVQRRLIAFVVVLLVLMVAATVIINHATGRWESWGGRGGNRDDGGPPWQPFALIFIGTVIFVVVRKIRRTVAPLEEMMDAAGRVAEGDYSFRVTAAGPPDVHRVVSAFNTMTERLASNEEQRKHLLSDIAHELRTPLAVVQGTIEGMLDDVYPRDDAHLAPLLDQTKVIARLLNDLQTVATAEAGALTLHRTDTDIAELIEDVAASFTPMTSERGITLVTEPGNATEVDVDPVRIRQVLDNLVSNAIRYTPEGGSITLAQARHGDAVAITVLDTGRGMSTEDAAHMFERFVKSADSGGSGLGLAIAKGLVEAHGGSISAESAPGEGTTVTITLPVPE